MGFRKLIKNKTVITIIILTNPITWMLFVGYLISRIIAYLYEVTQLKSLYFLYFNLKKLDKEKLVELPNFVSNIKGNRWKMYVKELVIKKSKELLSEKE